MTRLVTGSIQVRPVFTMMKPAATTPADTPASAAMWRNAPLILRSPLRPDMNRSAVAVLTTMPIAATIITVPPATGAGSEKRRIASTAITTIAMSSSRAFRNAARIDELRKP